MEDAQKASYQAADSAGNRFLYLTEQFVAAQGRWPVRLEFSSGDFGIDRLCIEFDARRKRARPARNNADHEVYAALRAKPDVLSQAH